MSAATATDEQLRSLLIDSKVSAVLPPKQAPVVTLSPGDSVESALRTLATHKILSAPVVDVRFSFFVWRRRRGEEGNEK